jgi:hypothetical protein
MQLVRRPSETPTEIIDEEPPSTKGTRFEGFELQYVSDADSVAGKQFTTSATAIVAVIQPAAGKGRKDEFDDEGEATLRQANEAGLKVIDYALAAKNPLPTIKANYVPWAPLAFFDAQHDAHFLCDPSRSVPLEWFCKPTDYSRLIDCGWLKESDFNWPDAAETLRKAREMETRGGEYPYRSKDRPLPTQEQRYTNKIISAETIGIIIAGRKALLKARNDGCEGAQLGTVEPKEEDESKERHFVLELAQIERRRRTMAETWKRIVGGGFGGKTAR